MARRTEAPQEREGSHGDRVYTHPAFGQMLISRVTGGTTLYGSDFIHHSFISLKIQPSELHRGLSHDRYHAHLLPIIEVRMSEAQWAGALSRLNMGDGTPVTIAFTREDGELPEIPERQQADEFRSEVAGKARKAAQAVAAAIAEVEGVIGAGLSKTKREQVLGRLRRLEQDLRANMPFVVNSFDEHMEEQQERAQMEFNAYVQGVIARHGLEALGGSAPVSLPAASGKQITDGGSDAD